MLSKGRIMQGIEFLETAKVDLGAMGIRTSLPMLDRHSPLSYAIVQHVNWDLSPQHGHVDCVNRSLQASFNDSGLLTKRYTATTPCRDCPS